MGAKLYANTFVTSTLYGDIQYKVENAVFKLSPLPPTGQKIIYAAVRY